jgi:hypothetical protein
VFLRGSGQDRDIASKGCGRVQAAPSRFKPRTPGSPIHGDMNALAGGHSCSASTRVCEPGDSFGYPLSTRSPIDESAQLSSTCATRPPTAALSSRQKAPR